MITFIDSSAILKLFLWDESGRETVRNAMSIGVRSAMSRLAYVEVRSGLAAAKRSGRLAPAAHEQEIAQFDELWPEYDLVEIDDDLTRRAGDLADVYGLFTGHAIQLASALTIDADDVAMVAWDTRLRAASSAAGLTVLPVHV